jgi:purine-nucleoside phosphorylase
MKKLYGDFGRQDWLSAWGMTATDVPHALIIHGIWGGEGHLKPWLDRFGVTAIRPDWNTVIGMHDGVRIGYCFAHGAPSATVSTHPLAVMGTQVLIQTGYFGGVRAGVEYGDILIVSDAETEDGVSAAYVGGASTVAGDRGLVRDARGYCERHALPHQVGSVVSTGALCLETSTDVARWAARGHLGVDMETASTFAVAQRFGRRAVALLNLSDRLDLGDTFYSVTKGQDDAVDAVDERIIELALHLAVSTAA